MAVDKYVGFVDTGSGDALPIGSTLYGTCSTAKATSVKAVTMPAFDRLEDGVTIHVKFSNAVESRSVSDPNYLNVNNIGSIEIYPFTFNCVAGSVISFTYISGSPSYWAPNDWTPDTNTDTQVSQNKTTTNNTYPILLTNTANKTSSSTDTARFCTDTKINPSNGYLVVGKISTDGTNYYEVGAAAEKAVGSVANANTGLVTGGDVWTAIQQASAGALIYGGVVTAEADLGTSYTAGTYWIVGSVSAGTTIAGQVVEAGDMIIAHAAYSGTIADDVDIVQANVDRLTDTDIDNAIAAAEAA